MDGIEDGVIFPAVSFNMSDKINSNIPKSYNSIIHHGNEDYDEPSSENQNESFNSRRKSRVIAAVTWILLAIGCLTVRSKFSPGVDPFAEMLNMALPQDADVPELEGMAPAWAECKAKGKEIATQCYELNPVDKKGCEDRGKEAAKACYKEMGKEYKNYWKGMGKQYKSDWKAKGKEKKDYYKAKGEAKKEEFKGDGS